MEIEFNGITKIFDYQPCFGESPIRPSVPVVVPAGPLIDNPRVRFAST